MAKKKTSQTYCHHCGMSQLSTKIITNLKGYQFCDQCAELIVYNSITAMKTKLIKVANLLDEAAHLVDDIRTYGGQGHVHAIDYGSWMAIANELREKGENL